MSARFRVGMSEVEGAPIALLVVEVDGEHSAMTMSADVARTIGRALCRAADICELPPNERARYIAAQPKPEVSS